MVTSLVVYPVKSLGGMEVREWPLGARGLLLDREWALVGDADGAVLSLRDQPRLAAIHARVRLADKADLSGLSGELVLSHRLCGELEEIRVPFGAGESGSDHSDLLPPAGLQAWLAAAVGLPCSLVRFGAGEDSKRAAGAWHAQVERHRKGTAAAGGLCTPQAPPRVAFANEAQLLVVSAASVADLNARVVALGGGGVVGDADRPMDAQVRQ